MGGQLAGHSMEWRNQAMDVDLGIQRYQKQVSGVM